MKRIETHISKLFLFERDVFKLKKPVNFGFLDFTTLEARRRACEAEVELNRRLAPGVYLGVVPIHRGGRVADWAVHMTRLDDRDRADLMLRRGMLGPAAVSAIAQRLAAFHQACPSDGKIAAYGSPETIAFNVRENFAQAQRNAVALLGRRAAEQLERWQLAFLHQHDHLFRRRIAQGRVREGHGDLRLEHVYFTRHGLRVIDCIEFNERFRMADVCADLAFLSMDLAANGRVDLAELLLARYARASDDYDLYGLVDFYESYRAYVRAKIATFTGDDAAARRFFLLALSASRRSIMPPAVIAVGGVIAAGKSTIAERLGDACSAPIVDADRTRKHLAGVPAETPMREGAWQGAYDPEFTTHVYEEVFRRAGVVLASGRPVVIDASFRSRRWRALARELARTHGVPFHFVECVAPAEVCRARLKERAQSASVSDGRIEIFDAFCKSYEPPVELAPHERITIDTSRPIPDNLAHLTGRLEAWPAGLSA